MTDAFNASDIKAIARLTRIAKRAEAERRGVVLSVMSNPAGRNWMHDRLTRCHVFSPSFSLQALSMAFAEGERNIGLQDLTDIMQFAPDQYIQMMREASDRSQANGRSHDDNGQRGSDSNGGRADSGRPDDQDGSGVVDSEYEPGHDEA